MDGKIVDTLLELSKVLNPAQRDSIAKTSREFLDRVEQIQIDVKTDNTEEANLRLRNLYSHLWVFHIACVAPSGLISDTDRKELIESAKRQEYQEVTKVYEQED